MLSYNIDNGMHSSFDTIHRITLNMNHKYRTVTYYTQDIMQLNVLFVHVKVKNNNDHYTHVINMNNST